MWRWMLIAVISVALGVVFVGCGGDTEQENKGEENEEETKPPEPPKPEVTVLELEGKWQGKMGEEDYEIVFTKNDKGEYESDGVSDLLIETETVTFKKDGMDHKGTWNGDKAELHLTWGDGKTFYSVYLKIVDK